MTHQDPLTHSAIARLLTNSDPWLSCDDCFEQLDIAIEGAVGNLEGLSDELRVHLTACAVCHEEAQSLAALIADDFGLSPVEAVIVLEGALAGS